MNPTSKEVSSKMPNSTIVDLSAKSLNVFETLTSVIKNLETNKVKAWHNQSQNLTKVRTQNQVVIQKFVETMNFQQFLVSASQRLSPDHIILIATFLERQFYCESDSLEEYRGSAINYDKIRLVFLNLIKLTQELHEERNREGANSASQNGKKTVAVIDDEEDSIGHRGQKRAMSNITTQGCSRVFILHVLKVLREEVIAKKIEEVITIDREVLASCLKYAYNACLNPTHEDHSTYGGIIFSVDNKSTYWTEPDQLLSWWKDNIEKKSKLDAFTADATYTGVRLTKIQRKQWSQAILDVVKDIKTAQTRNESNKAQNTSSLQLRSHVKEHNQSLLQSNPSSSPPSTNISSPVGQSVEKKSNPVLPSTETLEASKLLKKSPEKLFVELFLYQLHDALTTEQNREILGFNINGMHFSIFHVELFNKIILPKYYNEMNFELFQSILRNLQFSFLQNNQEEVIFFHKSFQKNRKDLIPQLIDSIPEVSLNTGFSSIAANMKYYINSAAISSHTNTATAAVTNNSNIQSSSTATPSTNWINSALSSTLLPQASTALPVQQQISLLQSQLITAIYNNLLNNNTTNGVNATTTTTTAPQLPSILMNSNAFTNHGSSSLAYPLPDQYNSHQAFPGFGQGYYNSYNPWMMNYQPNLMNLYQQLQQQNVPLNPSISNAPPSNFPPPSAMQIPRQNYSAIPSNSNNYNNTGNSSYRGNSVKSSASHYSYPTPTTAPSLNQSSNQPVYPSNLNLNPAALGSFTPNINSNFFHGTNNSSIQLPNLTNVTMASKIANNIANTINRDLSYLKLNTALPNNNNTNTNTNHYANGSLLAGYYNNNPNNYNNNYNHNNYHSNRYSGVGEQFKDSFRANSYLKKVEPFKEPINNGMKDETPSLPKTKKRSKDQSGATTGLTVTMTVTKDSDNDGGSSENATNQKPKKRKRLANTTMINNKVLRTIPAPILSHALVQSSLAMNRLQVTGDDSDQEESLQSMDDGEEDEEEGLGDEEGGTHERRSGKTYRPRGRPPSAAKAAAKQIQLLRKSIGSSKNSFEDIIDLRVVGKKRIFIDFTVNQDETLQNNPDAKFVCGYFNGKLIANDECTNYRFGNPRNASSIFYGYGEFPDGSASYGSASSVFSSGERSEHSRVGYEYQADIPECLSRKQLAQSKPKDIEENRVWTDSNIDNDDIQALIKSLLQKKKDWKPTKGRIYMVHFPNSTEGSVYRVCAVLEVSAAAPTAKGRGRKSRDSLSSFTVKVHDGVIEEEVPVESIIRYLRTEEEGFLDRIHEADYDLEEVARSFPIDRIGNDDYESFHSTWTLNDVEQLLIGMRKYKDIRKIWNVYFLSNKTYKDIVTFYNAVHPYLQDDLAEQFLKVYYYAEAAKSDLSADSLIENSPILAAYAESRDLANSFYLTRSKQPNELDGLNTTGLGRGGSFSKVRNNDKFPTIIASEGYYGTLSIANERNNIRKDGKETRGIQSDEKAVLPLSHYFGRRLFCICRTPISETDSYIQCIVGRPSNCNGWVHLSCAKYDHLSESTLKKSKKYREFICNKCLAIDDGKDEQSFQDG